MSQRILRTHVEVLWRKCEALLHIKESSELALGSKPARLDLTFGSLCRAGNFLPELRPSRWHLQRPMTIWLHYSSSHDLTAIETSSPPF
jgi:hypothetical protein